MRRDKFGSLKKPSNQPQTSQLQHEINSMKLPGINKTQQK